VRSKKERKETSFENDFFTYLVDKDPVTYSKAISSFDFLFRKEAIKVEIDSLLQNQTLKIVDLPLDAKPISYKLQPSTTKKKNWRNGGAIFQNACIAYGLTFEIVLVQDSSIKRKGGEICISEWKSRNGKEISSIWSGQLRS